MRNLGEIPSFTWIWGGQGEGSQTHFYSDFGAYRHGQVTKFAAWSFGGK